VREGKNPPNENLFKGVLYQYGEASVKAIKRFFPAKPKRQLWGVSQSNRRANLWKIKRKREKTKLQYAHKKLNRQKLKDAQVPGGHHTRNTTDTGTGEKTTFRISDCKSNNQKRHWIPAYAGMTTKKDSRRVAFACAFIVGDHLVPPIF
jgi:hypothetical protein